MPITIRELLASDTISQAADKINFNFDQLLLNGGGPQGPQGPQGPPGPIGGRGIRGSVWYEDTSITSPGNNPNTVPPTLTPEDEDNYLQFNGVVWTYDASIPAWVPTGVDLTGPVGPPGASGKFGEYQALPYTAAGDTTIFPDRMSAASEDTVNQAVRSVLIGGFPETIYNPTPSIPGGTSIVSDNIAQSLVKNSYTMMLHQFDSNDTALVFHGGDVTEDFEQGAITELSYIKLQADDALRIVSPKARTGVSNAFPGIYIEATKRAIDIEAGRELTIRTGTANTSDTYLGQDNFEVLVDQSIGSTTEPYARIRTIVPGQQAELRIGETSTPTTTTTNSGNLVGLAGKISLIGSDAMNLRTTTDITIDAGTSIDIDATNDIDVTSSSGDISLSAVSGEFSSTSQTVDVNATATIDVIGAGLVTVQSTGNDLNLFATGATSDANLYAVQDVNIHSKVADVNIFTDTGTGGNILIRTDNSAISEGSISIFTQGDLSPMFLLTSGNNSGILTATSGTTSPISLQTFAASDIELDSGNDINIEANNNITIDATGLLDIDANDITIDATNNITLTSGNDIILKHGSNDEVLIQPTSGRVELNLKPASGSFNSSINIFHDAADPNSNLLLRSSPADEGLVVVSDGMSLRLSGGNTAGDQVIITAERLGGALGNTDEPTFKVDGHIYYDTDPTTVINTGIRENIFSSGKHSGQNLPFWSSMTIIWQRVGQVVSGSGVGTWNGTSTVYPVPIVGPGGVADINGVWILHRNVDDTLGEHFRGGTVLQNGSGSSFNFLPLSSAPSVPPFTENDKGIATGDRIRFTFSYRLI
jgi:hypothetical protein